MVQHPSRTSRDQRSYAVTLVNTRKGVAVAEPEAPEAPEETPEEPAQEALADHLFEETEVPKTPKDPGINANVVS